MTDVPWIKASASSGDCVEMRRLGGSAEVRDSKDPQGPKHVLTLDDFAAWLDAAKNGSLDRRV